MWNAIKDFIDEVDDKLGWKEDRARNDRSPSPKRESSPSPEREPTLPAPPNRMDCAPSWNSVIDAVDRGVTLAESMSEATGRNNEETAADAGFFGLVYGAGQFIKDSWNIQQCMDKQDEKYTEDMSDYIDQVSEGAFGSKSSYTPSRDRDIREYAGEFNRVGEERHKNGLPPITTWEYDAMVQKDLDPIDSSSLSQIPNSDLCPNGGVGNYGGYSEIESSGDRLQADRGGYNMEICMTTTDVHGDVHSSCSSFSK